MIVIDIPVLVHTQMEKKMILILYLIVQKIKL